MGIITFEIDKNQKIEIVSENPQKLLFRYEKVQIYYHNLSSKVKLKILDKYIIEVLDKFEIMLKLILNKHLELDKSMTENIGFLWNEYLQEKTNHIFIEEKSESKECESWIGTNYILWSIWGLETWIYSKKNTIYLEITPVYKWHFDEPEKNEKFIPYDEFIKNYEPIAVIKISKETAKKWLAKTEKLLKYIKLNDPEEWDIKESIQLQKEERKKWIRRIRKHRMKKT